MAGQHSRSVFCWSFILLALCLYRTGAVVDNDSATKITNRPPLSLPQHTSNHAVIVSSSRYWFNYRHASNAISIYQILKRYGFVDENIVLMLADEYTANARNPTKNALFNTATDSLHKHVTTRGGTVRPSLMSDTVQIDYRGEDVTVENFINVLLGRKTERGMPVLESDADSNVLVYLTGHGGDQFFKFQDVEELMAEQLAQALRQMHTSARYKNVLVLADTCQAFTMGDAIVQHKIPNVSVIGSSLRDESSYAHMASTTVGLSTIEKYTHYFVTHVLENDEDDDDDANYETMHEQTLYQAMVEPFTKQKLGANVGMTDVNAARPLAETPLRDYFANVQSEAFWSDEATRKQARSSGKGRLIVQDVPLDVRLISAAPAVRFSTKQRKSANSLTGDVGTDQCLAQADEKPLTRQGEGVVEPNDPIFLGILAGLLGVVVIASRRW